MSFHQPPTKIHHPGTAVRGPRGGVLSIG